MKDSFNREFTKEKIQCRYWRGTTQLEDASHNLFLEDSHGLYGGGPDRQGRKARHRNW